MLNSEPLATRRIQLHIQVTMMAEKESDGANDDDNNTTTMSEKEKKEASGQNSWVPARARFRYGNFLLTSQ